MSNTTILKSTIIINTSVKTVWSVIKNPDKIHLYHPLIKDSFMLGEKKLGNDSKRKCILRPMGEMIEEIRDWKEGNSYTTEVVEGKMLPPFEFMNGQIKLTPIDMNQTEASFTFNYKLKFGIIGRIMNVLLIKPQFKSAPMKYVTGLKEFVEAL